MGKKLPFLIIALILLLSLPAYSQESNLLSKIGIQSIGDKKKTLIFVSRG